MSIKYQKNNEKWYSIEYIPDTPRSILIYTEDGGVSEGSFSSNTWFQYRWGCSVTPIAWREMPTFENGI